MTAAAHTEFLPAAMEMQAVPPSPAGRATIWVIMVLFAAAVVWASVGHVDVVAVASGRIIPSGHTKTVQPLATGIVTAIHVVEGQRVAAGDVLLQLDDQGASADVRRLRDEHVSVTREIARYRQLLAWLEPGSNDPQAPAVSEPLLIGQWREYKARMAMLGQERVRLLAEQETSQAQVVKLDAVLPLITRRADGQRDLVKQQLLPEQQYLELEQQRLEVLHDRNTQRGRVDEIAAKLDELNARIALTDSEFRRQVLERLEQAQQHASTSRQELVKAQVQLASLTLRAPVDGTVHQLVVHNAGAVVTPAQALMMIVPDSEGLEVEAVLENRDIGFVDVGQSAEVKVDTFPFTKYGTVSGEIVDLSNDAVADEQKGLVYTMRVRMDVDRIAVNGRQVSLVPGMTVSVEAKTGTRRLIEFFLSPLLRYQDESVRER